MRSAWLVRAATPAACSKGMDSPARPVSARPAWPAVPRRSPAMWCCVLPAPRGRCGPHSRCPPRTSRGASSGPGSPSAARRDRAEGQRRLSSGSSGGSILPHLLNRKHVDPGGAVAARVHHVPLALHTLQQRRMADQTRLGRGMLSQSRAEWRCCCCGGGGGPQLQGEDSP